MEFERRIQLISPDLIVDEKPNSDLIFSILNEAQDRYVMMNYVGDDQMETETNIHTRNTDSIKSLLVEKELTATGTTLNGFTRYRLPYVSTEEYFLYVHSFSKVKGTYKQYKDFVRVDNQLVKYRDLGIDGSKLSIGQLISFKDFKPDALKSYIDKIQAIKNEDLSKLNNDKQDLYQTLQLKQYGKALSDLEPKQAAILLSMQDLSNAQIEQALAAQKLTPELINQAMLEAGLLSSKQKLTTAQIEETLQTVLGSDADIQATMSAMELKVATDAQGNSVAKLTKKNIEAAVASGKLTQEQALQLASMLGVDMAVKKQASSTLPKWIATLKLSAKAIWENITATLTWLATTPAGWATLAVSAITVATIAVIKHTKSLKDLQETAQDSKSAYDNTISEIKSLNDELKRELRLKEAIVQTEGKKAAADVLYDSNV